MTASDLRARAAHLRDAALRHPANQWVNTVNALQWRAWDLEQEAMRREAVAVDGHDPGDEDRSEP